MSAARESKGQRALDTNEGDASPMANELKEQGGSSTIRLPPPHRRARQRTTIRNIVMHAFAVGVAFRREALSAYTDANGNNTGPTAKQWIGGTFADAFSHDRRIAAGYAEFRIPLMSPEWNVPGIHAFDLAPAIREESYSDAGYSNVPKLGFRWQPYDEQVTLRGGFSRSFTAPTLYAQYGPTDTRQVGASVIKSVFGSNYSTDPITGEDGNNPDLKPSKATTYSLGVVAKPNWVPRLRLEADYLVVHQSGFPGGIGFTNILQSVNQLGSASPFYNNVALNNFPGQPGATLFSNPGDILNYLNTPGSNSTNIYAIDQFRNLGGIRLRTVNLQADYETRRTRLGTFSLGTQGTYFNSYEFQALPGQAFYQYAGYATNGGTGVQGTLPRWRFYSVVSDQWHNWNAMIANTYISSVTDIGPGGVVYANSTTLKAVPVSSYMTWDTQLGYGTDVDGNQLLKHWSISAGVNNVFNRMPPPAPQAFSDNNADVSTYSPIGRQVYVSAVVKF